MKTFKGKVDIGDQRTIDICRPTAPPSSQCEALPTACAPSYLRVVRMIMPMRGIEVR